MPRDTSAGTTPAGRGSTTVRSVPGRRPSRVTFEGALRWVVVTVVGVFGRVWAEPTPSARQGEGRQLGPQSGSVTTSRETASLAGKPFERGHGRVAGVVPSTLGRAELCTSPIPPRGPATNSRSGSYSRRPMVAHRRRPWPTSGRVHPVSAEPVTHHPIHAHPYCGLELVKAGLDPRGHFAARSPSAGPTDPRLAAPAALRGSLCVAGPC